MDEPTQEEIDVQLNKAMRAIDAGVTRYSGMTYEEGVANAISWMQGVYDDPPFDPKAD